MRLIKLIAYSSLFLICYIGFAIVITGARLWNTTNKHYTPDKAELSTTTLKPSGRRTAASRKSVKNIVVW